MTVKMLSSSASTATDAAREIIESSGELDVSLVLWFASPRLEPARLAQSLSDAFPNATCLGCTSAGELLTGKMLEGALVAMVADRSTLASAHVALVDDVKDAAALDRALGTLASAVGVPSATQIDPMRYVGLILQDGLSGIEELVMAKLSGSTNVRFVGGSAGDDLAFQSTQVFVGAQGGDGKAALALLEPKRGFHILKTQNFDVLDQVLEVTECIPSTRTVIAFNGRPAAVAYAEALGTSPEQLPKFFGRNPLGLVIDGGEPFVRSPRFVNGTDVSFHCQVLRGMRLHVLRATDIIETTQKDVLAALEAFGDCSALINFHCALRTLELKELGKCEDYGTLFRDVPTIGLTTYGESYVGHINQTSTMLLLS